MLFRSDKDGNELPKITLEEYITKARESMVANSAKKNESAFEEEYEAEDKL